MKALSSHSSPHTLFPFLFYKHISQNASQSSALLFGVLYSLLLRLGIFFLQHQHQHEHLQEENLTQRYMYRVFFSRPLSEISHIVLFYFFTLSFCVHDLHLLFKLLIFFLGFWESLGGKEKWELSQLEKQTLELCACALVFVEKKVTVLEIRSLVTLVCETGNYGFGTFIHFLCCFCFVTEALRESKKEMSVATRGNCLNGCLFRSSWIDYLLV